MQWITDNNRRIEVLFLHYFVSVVEVLLGCSGRLFNQGILMRIGGANDYTLSGRVVTFEEAPANDANVLFSYIAE